MQTTASLRASIRPHHQARPPQTFIEVLESRIAPAFVGAVSGSTATFTGSDASEVLVIAGVAGFLSHDRFTAGDPGFESNEDFDSTVAGVQTVAVNPASLLIVRLGGGNDVLSFSGAVTQTQIFGGSGNDTINGGNAVDVIFGGPGNDIIDGNQGNDIVHGGEGADTFQWDPGDGSDTLNGNAGKDRLIFNGSAGAEIFAFSANSDRILFTRNVGNIIMSLGTIESMDLNSFGGTDSITVNDLSTTGLRSLVLDLGAGGIPDAAEDTLFIHGTSFDDLLNVSRSEGDLLIRGLATQITIESTEGIDDLTILGNAGLDNASIALSALSGVTLVVDTESSFSVVSGAAFGTPASLDTGLAPSAVVAGKLRNASNDLVIANAKGNSISILLRGTNGIFEEPVELSTGGKAPKSVVLEDFNRDGDLDIAVSNSGSGNVAIFLNTGGGVFADPVLFSIGAKPGKLRAADVNGDGHSDLIAIVGGNRLGVLPGDGTGEFGAPTLLPTGGVKPTDFLFEDFNGDGNADIAVTFASGNRINVLPANADGSFAAPLRFKSGLGASAVAVGDFNSDGKLDLAITHSVSRFVAVLFNLSTNVITFSSPVKLSNPGANLANALAVDDLDRDGLDDIVVANTGTGTVSIFRGALPGSFLPPVRVDLDNSPARKLASAIVADLNGDGTPDIATANPGSGDISIVPIFFR